MPRDLDPLLIEEFVIVPPPNNDAVSSSDFSSSDSEAEDTRSEHETVQDFTGRRDLVKLLQWLAYCDKASILRSYIINTFSLY